MSSLDARWSIAVEVSFQASHRLEGSIRCFRDHGHHWTAEVVVSSSEMEREGYPRGAEHIERDWTDIVKELDYRPLDKMIPGIVASPLGIANYLFERIAPAYPETDEVKVSDGDGVWGRKSRG